jgi:hypothetical protein
VGQTALGEAQARFDRAADRLRLDSGTRDLLERRRGASETRRLDDGRVRRRHERAERDQVSLRDAAYAIAIGRVARACRERGWV